MKNIREWLVSYKRYYLRGLDVVIPLVMALFFALIAYWIGYGNGWDDSFQMFDKMRPYRPMLG